MLHLTNKNIICHSFRFYLQVRNCKWSNERSKVTQVVFLFLHKHCAVVVYSEFNIQMETYVILQSFGQMSYTLGKFQQL